MSCKSLAGIGGGVELVIVLLVALLGGNPSELLSSLNSTDSGNGSIYVEDGRCFRRSILLSGDTKLY
ncbi:hypothetical protein [Peribacillus sp. NPDC096540]|uniref:hypothetical protein n=1 Tax=Peribacillus sp. NPDC096540 TaxID=3390612 RepID=UPI003D0079DD